MRSHIEAKIAEIRKRRETLGSQLVEIKRQLDIADAEMRAYEDVLSHMPAEAPTGRQSSRRASPGARRLSEPWRRVIGAIASVYPATVDSPTLYKVVAVIAPHMKEDSIRSQVAALVKRGVIERVSPGVFRVSPEQERKADAIRPGDFDDLPLPDSAASAENGASTDASETETAGPPRPAASNPFTKPSEANVKEDKVWFGTPPGD